MLLTRIHRALEGGAALVTALVIMLALMIIGVSAARTAVHGEKSARGERDRSIGLQAAEAALADAEHDIDGGGDPASARAMLFTPGSADGFVAGCGAAPNINAGLCLHAGGAGRPAWQSVDLSRSANDEARSVAFGQFTGASMPVGHATLPARLPRYIVERMSPAPAGEGGVPPVGDSYRVTAIGFGASAASQVVLQSFYLKGPARSRRLAWREISNWQDLHEAALKQAMEPP